MTKPLWTTSPPFWVLTTFRLNTEIAGRLTSIWSSTKCCRASRKRNLPNTATSFAKKMCSVQTSPGRSFQPHVVTGSACASTQMKMTPAEAITATTINAAYSLGRGDEIGSLEKGKRADFVIHDASDHRELAYFFGIEHARHVYSSGKLVFSRN